jgi:hypothetical protein
VENGAEGVYEGTHGRAGEDEGLEEDDGGLEHEAGNGERADDEQEASHPRVVQAWR